MAVLQIQGSAYSRFASEVFVLQSTYMASGEIDEAAVYQCTGNPLPQDLEQIVNWLMNEDFATCYNSEDNPLPSLPNTPCPYCDLSMPTTSCKPSIQSARESSLLTDPYIAFLCLRVLCFWLSLMNRAEIAHVSLTIPDNQRDPASLRA